MSTSPRRQGERKDSTVFDFLFERPEPVLRREPSPEPRLSLEDTKELRSEATSSHRGLAERRDSGFRSDIGPRRSEQRRPEIYNERVRYESLSRKVYRDHERDLYSERDRGSRFDERRGDERSFDSREYYGRGHASRREAESDRRYPVDQISERERDHYDRRSSELFCVEGRSDSGNVGARDYPDYHERSRDHVGRDPRYARSRDVEYVRPRDYDFRETQYERRPLDNYRRERSPFRDVYHSVSHHYDDPRDYDRKMRPARNATRVGERYPLVYPSRDSMDDGYRSRDRRMLPRSRSPQAPLPTQRPRSRSPRRLSPSREASKPPEVRRKPLTCRCCGTFEHLVAKCPQANQSCFYCKEKGHVSSGCPKNPHVTRCFCCGDPTHEIGKCRHRNATCYVCKAKGHLDRVCDQNPDAMFKIAFKSVSRKTDVVDSPKPSSSDISREAPFNVSKPSISLEIPVDASEPSSSKTFHEVAVDAAQPSISLEVSVEPSSSKISHEVAVNAAQPSISLEVPVEPSSSKISHEVAVNAAEPSNSDLSLEVPVAALDQSLDIPTFDVPESRQFVATDAHA